MKKPIAHELKCWPRYFEAMVAGNKRFELRRNDRGFEVGDTLYFREWDPKAHRYTGRVAWYRVTYLLAGTEHLADGFCAMSVEPVLPRKRESTHD